MRRAHPLVCGVFDQGTVFKPKEGRGTFGKTPIFKRVRTAVVQFREMAGDKWPLALCLGRQALLCWLAFVIAIRPPAGAFASGMCRWNCGNGKWACNIGAGGGRQGSPYGVTDGVSP